ncbi:hypothetical protein K431DRAFT_289906 [Polychaeton citri CBS 116435]|uniref:Secreted protein n=1 Tax=Polychaeton citri CBS 116435 TaxID=1314669 RepID=A0A9P4Q0G3_9PEZI|nr:hypothetical protein K431DRAFT_289906 [Polychaeton citri CBS 116435]
MPHASPPDTSRSSLSHSLCPLLLLLLSRYTPRAHAMRALTKPTVQHSDRLVLSDTRPSRAHTVSPTTSLAPSSLSCLFPLQFRPFFTATIP